MPEMKKTDRFNHLISFTHAARFGSFSAAAEALDLTPAAVSKNVALLEQALNVRLFNRTTRSLSLTEEGQVFYAESKKALALLEEAVNQITLAESQEIAGNVRISMPNVVGRNLVFPLLKSFNEDYPKIHLELDFDNKAIDFVKAGFDFVLRVGESSEGSLVARHIGMIQTCLVASPAYLKSQGVPKNMADLPQHQLLMTRLPNGKLQPWTFNEQGDNVHFLHAQPHLVLTDAEMQTQAAVQGFGITQLPVYLALPYLQNGELVTILNDSYQPLKLSLNILFPHRTLLAQRVRTTMDYLLEQLKQHEGLRMTQEELKAFSFK
ncbi:LysR protein [[Mannheimia] succiniciproducens MBEL55E]|uniref:LysR protein n=2 Tax=Basfia TaxID=697331 RepID=Q65QL0_MANSM|nr:LysR protein [[Mannheimia] succiniciproducens MBEL55E]